MNWRESREGRLRRTPVALIGSGHCHLVMRPRGCILWERDLRVSNWLCLVKGVGLVERRHRLIGNWRSKKTWDLIGGRRLTVGSRV